MMKRNILAVVIPALLVAGAANAAEIYNKNGNKLDFYGKVNAEHDFVTSGDNTNNNDATYLRADRFQRRNSDQRPADRLRPVGIPLHGQ
ncbi:porin [Enterobacter kobei]|nr:porin [Enterobacter kobei]